MHLSDKQLASIKMAVNKAATDHLHARDAETALSHFADDVVAISNLRVFSARATLAKDVEEFYETLREVKEAAWHEPRIVVVDQNTATFTARFQYAFTDKDGEKTRLEGVWTALFVRHEDAWKIRLRHESFVVC